MESIAAATAYAATVLGRTHTPDSAYQTEAHEPLPVYALYYRDSHGHERQYRAHALEFSAGVFSADRSDSDTPDVFEVEPAEALQLAEQAASVVKRQSGLHVYVGRKDRRLVRRDGVVQLFRRRSS